MHAFGSRDPGAAPVWHAQADAPPVGWLASTEPPGRSGVQALRGARLQGTGGQRRLDTLTRRPLVELNASGCANRRNLPTARRVGRRRRAGLRQPREAAPRDRRRRCCEIVRGEARRSEPAVGWQRPPVLWSAQLGDRGRSPRRGRRGYRNRGKAQAGAGAVGVLDRRRSTSGRSAGLGGERTRPGFPSCRRYRDVGLRADGQRLLTQHRQRGAQPCDRCRFVAAPAAIPRLLRPGSMPRHDRIPRESAARVTRSLTQKHVVQAVGCRTTYAGASRCSSTRRTRPLFHLTSYTG